jgi:FkbH-like protein
VTAGLDVAPAGQEQQAPEPAPAVSPLRAISALKRAGLDAPGALAELRRLLGVLAQSGDALDLEAAGQVLGTAKVRAQLEADGSFREQRVALLASSNIDPVANLLTALLLRDATVPAIRSAGFNQWRLELLMGAPELAALGPRIVGCLLDDGAVFERIRDGIDLAEIEQRLEEFPAELAAWTESSRQTLGGLTVLTTIPLSPLRRDRLVDYRSRARLDAAWSRMNARLLDLGADGSAVVVAHEALALRAGSVFAEHRMRHVARNAYSLGYLAAYAEELARISRADLGRAAKTLILDLDNTLWSGIVGDDGTAGLKIGETYPGSAHTELQNLARDYSRQGVLLAVCSKNDDAVARDAVDNHPDMVLRSADLVAWRANWQPKPGNVAEIAAELNLGIDAMVFVDDSPFERGMMRSAQPEVRTLEVPADPAGYAAALAADGQFNILTLTAEDVSRTSAYKAQAQRDRTAATAGTMEDYLLGLGSVIEVEPLSEVNADRITQLFGKTNQFNLTGRRFGTEEIARMLSGGDSAAFGVRLRDDFGDLGLIAALVVTRSASGGDWTVENMVLSCRAFSRNIEDAVISLLLQGAAGAGAAGVRAGFVPSPKNTRFAAFYPGAGFAAAGAEGSFRHDLTDIPALPAWISTPSLPEVFHAD